MGTRDFRDSDNSIFLEHDEQNCGPRSLQLWPVPALPIGHWPLHQAALREAQEDFKKQKEIQAQDNFKVD